MTSHDNLTRSTEELVRQWNEEHPEDPVINYPRLTGSSLPLGVRLSGILGNDETNQVKCDT